MHYDLPSGLFNITANSNIGQIAINGLCKAAERLCRNIDILTDISHKNKNSDFVDFIKNTDKNYDYLFIADKINLAESYYSEYKDNANWFCYSSPCSNTPLKYTDAIDNRRNIFKIGYDAYFCPNAKFSSFGPTSSACIYTEYSSCNFIMHNMWDYIWKEIFRHCGFYNVKANLLIKEL